MASARRTSPRKKTAMPVSAEAAAVGAGRQLRGLEVGLGLEYETRERDRQAGANARQADVEGRGEKLDDQEDEDLPELSTLLGSLKMKGPGNQNTYSDSASSRGGEGKSDGEGRLASPDKNPAVRTRRTSQSSTMVGESGTEVPQDVESIARPAASAMSSSSSNLFSRTTPSLQPTKTQTPYLTGPAPPAVLAQETNTTTRIARSSRQILHRGIKCPAERDLTTSSPVKRSLIASSPQKPLKEEDGYPQPKSQTSVAKAQLPSADPTTTTKQSKNKSSTNRSLKPAHVNSLLLPLNGLALSSKDVNSEEEEDADIFQTKTSTGKSRSFTRNCSVGGSSDSRHAPSAKASAKTRRALFVLEEADCRDDGEGEENEELDDEDEEGDFTDLSGFIVDDDAEISFHDERVGSGAESGSGLGSELESEGDGRGGKKVRAGRRRRLVRGGGVGECRGKEGGRRDLTGRLGELSLEDYDGGGSESQNMGPRTDKPAAAVASMVLGDEDRDTRLSRPGRSEVEVVDLTSSPVKPHMFPVPHRDNTMSRRRRPLPSLDSPPLPSQHQDPSPLSESITATNDNEAILRVSPPIRRSPIKLSIKKPNLHLTSTTTTTNTNAGPPKSPPHTPPTSPSKPHPSSPTKLNSPSKSQNLLLLSPSKRGLSIPHSPHRPSIDAFWSSEVINKWNDQYSPLKPALTASPQKRWRIWEDYGEEENGSGCGNESESESEGEGEGASGSASPCESPARRIVSVSPTKPKATGTSPSKRAQSQILAAAKKADKAARSKFDSSKEALAHNLLHELDQRVSAGRLAQLSKSTGGVKIIWSKNLRSTAGRANWRRTVSNSLPGAGAGGGGGGGAGGGGEDGGSSGEARVHHHASIELAEKVIDDEERLVNTLAHEFCHLANFMVSAVRDQPHGVSFKEW